MRRPLIGLTLSALRHSQPNLLATAAGALLMMIALACSNVTIARGGYAGVLSTAIVCAALAVPCLAVPVVRGPLGWRIAGVVLALPVLFVVSDFIRRAPHAFGGG